MRRVGTVGLSLALVSLAGCLSTDAGPAAEVKEEVPPDFEHVVLRIERSLTPSYELELLEQAGVAPDLVTPVDACDCETQACLESWARKNLGCNVCVSLLCDGAAGPHVCAPCSSSDGEGEPTPIIH